jgi:glycine cleavage system transcriptional repressor
MTGTHHAVLTAIGADRPGLVDAVARYVLECGGNVADSRMLNLNGQFAMMMLVAGPPDIIARLARDLTGLERDSQVHAEVRAADLTQQYGSAAALPYRLNTWAMDHPGLVQSVAHLLGGMGVNIESADTSLRPAPYTNAPLFEMELVVAVPAELHIAELRERLGALCDDLNIDWQLTAL